MRGRSLGRNAQEYLQDLEISDLRCLLRNLAGLFVLCLNGLCYLIKL